MDKCYLGNPKYPEYKKEIEKPGSNSMRVALLYSSTLKLVHYGE